MFQETRHGHKKREKEGAVKLPLPSKITTIDEETSTGAERVSGERERASGNIVDGVSVGVVGDKTGAILVEGHGEIGAQKCKQSNVDDMRSLYDRVTSTGFYNFAGARTPVPSGLNIAAWRQYLADYTDPYLVDFLEFGWPINFDRDQPLVSTPHNHPSATRYSADIDFYIETELGFGALAGPFDGPPITHTHLSPLMTRPKKDAKFCRVIMDLSWPPGLSVNDGVDSDFYVDGPARISLPTVDFMEARVLSMGKGAYMFKTDLSRGYRQLRVDPCDWHLLGFQHQGKYYLDSCPPFGLKSSAMCMQRTTEAIAHIHATKGYRSRPYLDDFGGGGGQRGRRRRQREH